MNRQEHLQWCKARAQEYLDRGDTLNAWASFTSDMSKHPETEKHVALELGMMLLMSGHNQTAPEMQKFIQGFN